MQRPPGEMGEGFCSSLILSAGLLSTFISLLDKYLYVKARAGGLLGSPDLGHVFPACVMMEGRGEGDGGAEAWGN